MVLTSTCPNWKQNEQRMQEKYSLQGERSILCKLESDVSFLEAMRKKNLLLNRADSNSRIVRHSYKNKTIQIIFKNVIVPYWVKIYQSKLDVVNVLI